jgi:hypothetical protein
LFAPHKLASFPRIDRVRVAVQVGRRHAGEHQRAIKLGAEKKKKSFLGLEVSAKRWFQSRSIPRPKFGLSIRFRS